MPRYPRQPDLAEIIRRLAERVAVLEQQMAQIPVRSSPPPPPP